LAWGALGSTEDVAARAGVGIATLFRHFPTKEALIEAALLRHFDRLNQQAVELGGQSDPAEALSQLLARTIDAAATKLTLASLIGEPSPEAPQRGRGASRIHERDPRACQGRRRRA
jgi:AcrR family transcriptional regulator